MGCRVRAPKPDLIRVVVTGTSCVPDIQGRLPGRGAYLHPELACLDLAERRRAFPRAFKVAGPLEGHLLRRVLEEQQTDRPG